MNNIEKFLKNNNITNKTKGYYYLVSAIEISLQINNRKIYPCSDIYPLVASKFNTSSFAVEKSMRYTLKENEKYKNFTVGKFLNNELGELKINYRNDNKYYEMWNKLKEHMNFCSDLRGVFYKIQELEREYENE